MCSAMHKSLTQVGTHSWKLGLVSFQVTFQPVRPGSILCSVACLLSVSLRPVFHTGLLALILCSLSLLCSSLASVCS